MMRHHPPAQGDELGVAHVILGINGAPRADDEAPCAVGFENVIDGGHNTEDADKPAVL